jgi:hypothetical protein
VVIYYYTKVQDYTTLGHRDAVLTLGCLETTQSGVKEFVEIHQVTKVT